MLGVHWQVLVLILVRWVSYSVGVTSELGFVANTNSTGDDRGSITDHTEVHLELQAQNLQTDDTTDLPNYTYDLTGRQNLIIIMDISQSVSRVNFDISKSFLRDLITFTMNVHPNFTRLAFITYASEVNVEFDYISTGTPITGCELFAANRSWEQVRFVDHLYGSNIVDAFREAQKIFNGGQLYRTGTSVKQRLFLLTDAEQLPSDASLFARQLRNENVAIYGIGIGYHLKPAVLKNLTSQPVNTYYKSINDWKDLLEKDDSQAFRFKTGSSGVWQKVSDSLCPGCTSDGAACFCEAFKDTDPMCACKQGFEPIENTCTICQKGYYKGNLGNSSCEVCPDSYTSDIIEKQCDSGYTSSLIIYIVAAIVAFLIIVVMATCLLYRRRRKFGAHRQRDDSTSSEAGLGNTNMHTQTYDRGLPNIVIASSQCGTIATGIATVSSGGRAMTVRERMLSYGRTTSVHTGGRAVLPGNKSLTLGGVSVASGGRAVLPTRALQNMIVSSAPVTVMSNSHRPLTASNSDTHPYGIHNTSASSGNQTDQGSAVIVDNMTYADIKDPICSTDDYLHPIPSFRPLPPGVADADTLSEASSSHESRETILQISKKFRNMKRLPNSIKKLGRSSHKKKDVKTSSNDEENAEKISKDYENEEAINKIKDWKSKITKKIRRSKGSDKSNTSQDSKNGNIQNVKSIINKFESSESNVTVVKPKVHKTVSMDHQHKKLKTKTNIGLSLSVGHNSSANVLPALGYPQPDVCINTDYQHVYSNQSAINIQNASIKQGGAAEGNAPVYNNCNVKVPAYLEIVEDTTASNVYQNIPPESTTVAAPGTDSVSNA